MVEIEGAVAGAFTGRLISAEWLPAVFVAVTMNVETPAVVGVPLIAPVEEPRASPAGSVPLVTFHMIGAVPVAAKVCE